MSIMNNKILTICMFIGISQNIQASDKPFNLNRNEINTNNNDVVNYTTKIDSFTLTKNDKDIFVANYEKYPLLLSVNAQLLLKSLDNEIYNNYNEILEQNFELYFGEETFGIKDVICDEYNDEIKDYKSLLQISIWATVDAYIKSSNVNSVTGFNNEELETIVINTLKELQNNNSSNTYINDILNNTNKINELTNSLKFEIEKCNLYKFINSIVKSLNVIAKLHEKRINNIDNTNNIEELTRQYIYTLSNGNMKCSIMSAWELIRTILIQCLGEKYETELKNTDFAKFDNYLCNMFASHYDRIINNDKSKFKKINPEYWQEYNNAEFHDLTKDRTGKSNVEGDRIDLISELILWEENNRWINKSNNEDTKNRTKMIDFLR